MDALQFCHLHHACKASLVWLREKNKASGKALTLLQGFDLCPFGRFKTWAWCRCARRHNIINVFNRLRTELFIDNFKTLDPDDPSDSLVWAMAETCASVYSGFQAIKKADWNGALSGSYASGVEKAYIKYLEDTLGIRSCSPYDVITDAMEGKVSEIICDVGRPDVEAYDREYLCHTTTPSMES